MKHDMSVIHQNLQSLLDTLNETAHFDLYLNDEISYCEWEQNYRDLVPDDIGIACGLTRLAIWDKNNCDYVYKLQYDEFDINYGANELYIYEKAVNAGVDKFFAWTAKIVDYVGAKQTHSFYAMQFCDVDYYALEDASYKMHFETECADLGYELDKLTEQERDEVEGYIGDYTGTDGMIEYAWSLYCAKDMNALEAFLDKYHINDLHCGNWGYCNGELVITDYAGYNVDLTQVVCDE